MSKEEEIEEGLRNALWASADEMRKIMSADIYKDYLLGLIFFKALSDKILYKVVDLAENRVATSLEEAQKIYEETYNSEDKDDLLEELQQSYDCVIPPQYTFTKFYEQINEKKFMLNSLKQAFRDIEQSKDNFYSGLFEGFDIQSKDLGKDDQERNRIISSVMRALNNLNFNDYDGDALGNAYEYLIEKFASESGKKAGEFYTPKQVSELITKIVSIGKENKRGFSIYDPCMGSSSLLLHVRKFINSELKNTIYYFGQELKNQTYNLARMNMILHEVFSEQQSLHNADTLGADWPTDEPTNFDAVVMNPPYSQKYGAGEGLKTDPRFVEYGVLPPASKADYAFLLHGFYHLKTDGVMGIVLPHGVLFRGGTEGTIRKHLLEEGSIYAVIGLPENLFYSTNIPTCIIVLRKDNTSRDVLFIDASKNFEKEKTKNKLTDSNIDKIFNAYKDRKNIEKYAHLASFDEIKQNDFNLNIPRYVDTSEEEVAIDLTETFKNDIALSNDINVLNNELNSLFTELGLTEKLGD